MINFCKQYDCPLHNEYAPPNQVEDETTIDMDEEGIVHSHNYGHMISTGEAELSHSDSSASWQAVSIAPQETLSGSNGTSIIDLEKSIKLTTEHITCYVECMFCKHKENLDMLVEVIARKAKRLLEE